MYQYDAYHSLSIEGYEVTPELIERVRSSEWNPDANQSDTDQRNAMAAKGYANAFICVCESVQKVFAGGKKTSEGASSAVCHDDIVRNLS